MRDDTIQRVLEEFLQRPAPEPELAEPGEQEGTFVEWPPKPPPPERDVFVLRSQRDRK